MEFVMKMKADAVIVGTGVGGLFSALNLPRDKKIIMITKSDLESSDSFLAQGGICMLHDEDDYDSYFEDTMKAGHYENRKESVDIMIRSSREIIQDLIGYGVESQFRQKGADWYYYDEEGHLVLNRDMKIGKYRYIFQNNGAAYRGLKTENGKVIGFTPLGRQAFDDGVKDGNDWYYFDAAGNMKKDYWRTKDGGNTR